MGTFLKLFTLAAVFSASFMADAADKGFSFEKGVIDRKEAVAAARNTTAEKYPDADDVLVRDHTKVRYQQDGTSTSWSDSYQKILTEKGKREERTKSFRYTLPYSTVKIHLVEIIRPDGSCVPVDIKANSKEMTDHSQMGSNIYNPNDKILQLTIPNLEIGDMLHTVTSEEVVKPRVPNTWSDLSIFEYTCPILSSTMEVDAPSSLPLVNIKTRDEVKGTIKATRTEKDGRVVHKWEARDVPRMFEEPDMPPLWNVVQRVMLSTIPDWKFISKWYWELCRPHIEKTTPEMRETVDKLVAGVADRNKKIEAIFQYVSQNIRYMGLTTETVAPGYEPHDVDVTFNNKYGVCRDKAALLAAMLRLAGFKAWPVIINAGPKKDPDVPQPYFNHAITCVENDDGSYTLMDSTDETTRELLPAYLCDKSYLVAKPEGETLKTSPIVPAAENMMRISTSARLDADGTLRGESTLLFEGINDNAYRSHLIKLKPENKRDFFEAKIKSVIAGAKLESLEIKPENLAEMDGSLQVRLSFSARNYPVAGKENILLRPPWLSASFGVANFVIGKTSLEKRKYPLETDIACGIEESIELATPGTFGAPVCLPSFKTVDNGEMLWRRGLSVKNGTLSAKSDIQIKVVEFSPAQYAELKKSLVEIERNLRKIPVFARSGAESGRAPEKEWTKEAERSFEESVKEADILTLEETTEVDADGAGSATILERAKKRILTYAGKKKYSELKINYNPAWEEVSVRDVTVRQKNGSVKKLDATEVNIMDAPWAGNAPRYPAGKTLVASLPGVEAGSEIEYTLERKCSKRPFVSLIEYFRFAEPAVKKTFVFRSPSGASFKFEGGPSKPVVSEKNGVVERRWTAEKIPSVKNEPDLPPWWSFNPAVVISDGDWAKYCRTLSEKIKAASTGQARTEKIAAELTAKAKTDEEKAVAIRDWVAKNIREAGPSLTELPLECVSPADTTVADGYGNDLDIAVVLTAMLAKAGFSPDTLLASNYPDLEKVVKSPLSVPQRFFFTQPLVRIKVGGKEVILNDTDEYARLGATDHDDNPALALPDGKPTRLEPAKGMRNRVSARYDIDIRADGGAKITKTVEYEGMEHAGFNKKFTEMLPEKRNRYFQEAVASISQSARPVGKLETDTKAYPGRESMTVDVPNFATVEGAFMLFSLPGADHFLKSIFHLPADKRANPLYLPSELDTKIEYSARLPKEFASVKYMPESFTWDEPGSGGRIKLTSEHNPKERLVTLRCEVLRKPGVAPADEYGRLLGISERLAHPGLRTILTSK